MTIIRPNTQRIGLDRVLTIFLCTLLLSAISLVFLYNRLVNASHGIAEMDRTIKQLETENAEFKEKIFALFDAGTLRSLARERGFVEDRSPQYFQNPSWALASER